MLPLILLVSVTAFLIALVVIPPRLIERRRAQIRSQVFPREWREILRRNVPYFYRMPADLQLQLKKHMLVFLAEKEFYGFEGVQIDDEIRVTIAAQACLLLLNRKTDYYPKLKSIYVYPAPFITQHEKLDAAGVLQNQAKVLSGESWEFGKVILSWRDTKQGGQEYDDGHNVVIHEFAHQLDQETGVANGAPIMPSKKRQEWSRVLAENFAQLQRRASIGEASLLDYYGATNPAEFFAVASEVFFEQPQRLQADHLALYQQLRDYFKVDPANW